MTTSVVSISYVTETKSYPKLTIQTINFTILDLRNEWNSFAINDLKDSYFQEWTYEDRKSLEYTCQSGFLFSVVVVQWMSAIQVRSRKHSMFLRPLNNHCLNFALIFETLLAFAIIYLPGNEEVSYRGIIMEDHIP